MERTTEERVVAGLSHLAFLLALPGLVINVVLYVLYRPRSSFVAKHVKQALGLQVVSFLLGMALSLTFGVSVISVGFWSAAGALGTAALAWLVSMIVWIITLVLMAIAAVRGFQGEEYRHPIFGNFVDRLGE